MLKIILLVFSGHYLFCTEYREWTLDTLLSILSSFNCIVLQYSKRSDQIILIRNFYPLLCVNETKKNQDEIENLVPLPKSYAQAEQEYTFLL